VEFGAFQPSVGEPHLKSQRLHLEDGLRRKDF